MKTERSCSSELPKWRIKLVPETSENFRKTYSTEEKPLRIVRVTKTEFQMQDGRVFPIVPPLQQEMSVDGEVFVC